MKNKRKKESKCTTQDMTKNVVIILKAIRLRLTQSCICSNWKKNLIEHFGTISSFPNWNSSTSRFCPLSQTWNRMNKNFYDASYHSQDTHSQYSHHNIEDYHLQCNTKHREIKYLKSLCPVTVLRIVVIHHRQRPYFFFIVLQRNSYISRGQFFVA